MMKPIHVKDIDIAWGGDIEKLLPSYNKVPEEFKNGNSKWNTVINDWFYSGLKDCNWQPKEGIDTKEAIRHIKAILSSWKPKHEHKMAGCAYLLSEFFNDVTYEKVKK